MDEFIKWIDYPKPEGCSLEADNRLGRLLFYIILLALFEIKNKQSTIIVMTWDN